MPAAATLPESVPQASIGWRASKAALASRASRSYRPTLTRHGVPRCKTTPWLTALDTVSKALFPWENTPEYPGRIRGSVELFKHRVSYWAVVKWRSGKRQAPLWALATGAEECRKRIAALQHAAELCEAEIKKRQSETGA